MFVADRLASKKLHTGTATAFRLGLQPCAFEHTAHTLKLISEPSLLSSRAASSGPRVEPGTCATASI